MVIVSGGIYRGLLDLYVFFVIVVDSIMTDYQFDSSKENRGDRIHF